jgi:hypothetical protein
MVPVAPALELVLDELLAAGALELVELLELEPQAATPSDAATSAATAVVRRFLTSDLLRFGSCHSLGATARGVVNQL